MLLDCMQLLTIACWRNEGKKTGRAPARNKETKNLQRLIESDLLGSKRFEQLNGFLQGTGARKIDSGLSLERLVPMKNLSGLPT